MPTGTWRAGLITIPVLSFTFVLANVMRGTLSLAPIEAGFRQLSPMLKNYLIPRPAPKLLSIVMPFYNEEELSSSASATSG